MRTKSNLTARSDWRFSLRAGPARRDWGFFFAKVATVMTDRHPRNKFMLGDISFIYLIHACSIPLLSYRLDDSGFLPAKVQAIFGEISEVLLITQSESKNLRFEKNGRSFRNQPLTCITYDDHQTWQGIMQGCRVFFASLSIFLFPFCLPSE